MADIHGVSKVREIAVHDIGYRVVDSSSGNKAAAYVAIGASACHASVGVDDKERHGLRVHAVESLECVYDRLYISDCEWFDIFFHVRFHFRR